MGNNQLEREYEEIRLKQTISLAEEQLKQAKEAAEKKKSQIIEVKKEVRENAAHGVTNLYTSDGFEALVELSQYMNPVIDKIVDYEEEEHKILLLENMTKSPYFARIDFKFDDEEEFEKILKRNMKLPYEQIDFYPNQIYVMIYSREPIEERKVENSIRLLYADLTEKKAEMPSIIVGTTFFGIKEFSGRVKEMEDVRNDTFSYFSGVIYIAQKAARDTGTLEETMQMKDSIFRSIEDENMPAVEEQLLVYLKRLENEKASSAFYAKYLILDIVKAIYQKYGIYNESLIMQTADEIMNSHDLWKVGEVVSKVIREITVSQKQSLPDTSLTVSEIKKVIKNEYMHDIGLEEIAEKVCLTASYVSFIFKKETGYNLVKYLTDYRMKKAKELLEESNWKIVDIGKACGYTNQPYFNKLFKNYYGVTPKQYREQK